MPGLNGINEFRDKTGYLRYLIVRPFAALASPLPRVPRAPPRAVPPLAAGGAIPPRPAIRDAGAGVENFGVGFEDGGGLSTKDVSVVLRQLIPKPSKED